MNWVLDVIVIILLVLSMFLGYKKGFLRFASGIISFFLMIALTVVGIAAFLLLFYKLGVTEMLGVALYGAFGEASIFALIGLSGYAVAYYLGIVILAIIGFILSYVLVLLLFKGLAKALQNVGRKGWFRVVDGVIGLIVNFALVAAIILAIFAFVHAFAANDMMTNLDELFRAMPVSGKIYQFNPINDLVASFHIPETLKEVLPI